MAVRRSRRAGVTIAVAVSMTVHIATLAVFLLRREPLVARDPPNFSVELFSQAPRDPGQARPPPAKKPPLPIAPRRPDVLSSPARAEATSLPAPQPIDSSQAVGDRRDALRDTLRGRLGCDRATFFHLTAEERRRCEERQDRALAKMDSGPAPKFDLSKRGAFQVRDDTAYLARKPKNGCKVMTGGRTLPKGQETTMAGIGCAFSF